MISLVSIIVPVYNVEQYLEKCVKSICCQTYDNLEIILVDDGSTDNSGKMCDEFASKDVRIKAVHKKNGGLSDARNTGIGVSRGEYLIFIDSDDWISCDYVEYLYSLIEKYCVEIGICEIVKITEKGRIINKLLNDASERYFEPKQALHELLKTSLFSTSVCGKIYKRTLFTNRCFPVGKIYEDIPVSYDIFIEGHNIAFGAKAAYYYLTRVNSITTVKFTPRRMDAVEFVEKAMKNVLKKYPEFKEEAQIRLFHANFSLLYSFSDDEESKRYLKISKRNLRKYRIPIIFSNKATKKDKIKAICSIFNYRVVKKIMDVHKG